MENLYRQKTWDLRTMKPQREVELQAQKEGRKVHFGMAYGFVVVKHSELPEDQQIYKGRVVFRGNNVKDESGYTAVFSEQGSSSSHSSASNILDTVGHMPHNDVEVGDVKSAYTHAPMLEDETWVSLPLEAIPYEFKEKIKKVHRPVVRLLLALEGHPRAGKYWEEYCRHVLITRGWEPIVGWECLYLHSELKLLLSVDVDDIKIAGRKAPITKAWQSLTTGNSSMNIVAIRTYGQYLGVLQEGNVPCLPDLQAKIELDERVFSSKLVLDSDVQYTNKLLDQLARQAPNGKSKQKLQPTVDTNTSGTIAATVIQGSEHLDLSTELTQKLGHHKHDRRIHFPNIPILQDVRSYKYTMKGFLQQCVDLYLNLAKVNKSDLKEVSTPSLEESIFTEAELATKGEVADASAHIVLKILFAARRARPDLYWATNAFARMVTKWNIACDRKLHRLISYIHTRTDWSVEPYVGGHPLQCALCYRVDADYAGDIHDSHSTSGGYLILIGPRTFAPITWLCKKQTAISRSSTEAELIALDTGLRLDALPTLNLWEMIIELFHPDVIAKIPNNAVPGARVRSTFANELLKADWVPPSLPPHRGLARLLVCEDNEATIHLLIKGRSPRLRHTLRTFRTDLDFCHECMRDLCISAKWVSTKLQIADMFTKPGFTSAQWLLLCQLAQLVPSNQSPRSKKLLTQKPSSTLPSSTAVMPLLSTMIRQNVAIDNSQVQLSVNILP